MNRKRIILVALVLIVFGFAYYCYGGSVTPKGQPLSGAFSFRRPDAAEERVQRLSIFYSRGCNALTYCLQGASATEQLLGEINSKSVQAFVIWEPVLATDFTAPSTAALARIPDLRASQYWDRKRALSHLLGERNRSTVVWDYIAVYAPGYGKMLHRSRFILTTRSAT